MIIISAMSENRVIGSAEGMPWNVPAEYDQYLRFVDGGTVIMGSKTFKIFGADLPEASVPIVVSRSKDFPGVSVARSFGQAVGLAEDRGQRTFVAGGGSIYEQAIAHADQMYLSTIKGKFEGDTWFPEFDELEWEVIEERDEPGFQFRIYRRRKFD